MNTIFSRSLARCCSPPCCRRARVFGHQSGCFARQVETLVARRQTCGERGWLRGLEYPRGPFGVETYMVALGPDHAVREVRQVLSDEYISKLHVGMSRDEVRRLLGRPRDIGFSEPNDEEIWSWRYREARCAHGASTSSSTGLPDAQEHFAVPDRYERRQAPIRFAS